MALDLAVGLASVAGVHRNLLLPKRSTGELIADGLTRTPMPRPAILEAYNVEKTTRYNLSNGGDGQGTLLGNMLADAVAALGGTVRPLGAGSRRPDLPPPRPRRLSLSRREGAVVSSTSNRPSDPRFDRDGDWDAQQVFSEADRRLAPEEYAARRMHLWGCFALHFYRYRDPVLGAWVRRVGELFDNPAELEEWRARLLTDEERAEIREQAAVEF